MAASSCRINGDGAASIFGVRAGAGGATVSALRSGVAATSPTFGSDGVGRGGGGALTAGSGFDAALADGLPALSIAVTTAVVGGAVTGARAVVVGECVGLIA